MKPLYFIFTKFYANILEAKGKKEEAIAQLNEYLNNYKLDPEAWKYAAALYHEIGKGDKVMQLMDSAMYYSPKNEEISKLNQFYTYKYLISNYENALKLYNEKNYSEAIAYFKLSYSDFQKYGDPNQLPDFLNSWGLCLLETGKINEAADIFAQVSRKYPMNYFALKNLGFIAFQYQKNYSLAIDYYLKSLKAENPDLFQSYMNLGTIFLIQGEKNLAISNYESALSHGKSESLIKNLYLLWKEKGDSQKI